MITHISFTELVQVFGWGFIAGVAVTLAFAAWWEARTRKFKKQGNPK